MSDFLDAIDEPRIIQAIIDAEKNTSGEIRVHLEKICGEDIMNRSAAVFARLHMHKTKLRNGVLFYIAYEDRKYCIIGDAGINAVVGEDFWEEETAILAKGFGAKDFNKGICDGIARVGVELRKHFPFDKGLSGELPNEISYGDE